MKTCLSGLLAVMTLSLALPAADRPIAIDSLFDVPGYSAPELGLTVLAQQENPAVTLFACSRQRQAGIPEDGYATGGTCARNALANGAIATALLNAYGRLRDAHTTRQDIQAVAHEVQQTARMIWHFDPKNIHDPKNRLFEEIDSVLTTFRTNRQSRDPQMSGLSRCEEVLIAHNMPSILHNYRIGRENAPVERPSLAWVSNQAITPIRAQIIKLLTHPYAGDSIQLPYELVQEITAYNDAFSTDTSYHHCFLLEYHLNIADPTQDAAYTAEPNHTMLIVVVRHNRQTQFLLFNSGRDGDETNTACIRHQIIKDFAQLFIHEPIRLALASLCDQKQLHRFNYYAQRFTLGKSDIKEVRLMLTRALMGENQELALAILTGLEHKRPTAEQEELLQSLVLDIQNKRIAQGFNTPISTVMRLG